MRCIVLSVNKEKKRALLYDGERKFEINVDERSLRKVMRWDVVEFSEGNLEVLKRARVISVDKCVRLKKLVDLEVVVNVYGILSDEGNFLFGEKEKLKILNPLRFSSLTGKKVIIENALLRAEGLEIRKSSRIFSLK